MMVGRKAKVSDIYPRDTYLLRPQVSFTSEKGTCCHHVSFDSHSTQLEGREGSLGPELSATVNTGNVYCKTSEWSAKVNMKIVASPLDPSK